MLSGLCHSDAQKRQAWLTRGALSADVDGVLPQPCGSRSTVLD
jgi:hypothetical protein